MIKNEEKLREILRVDATVDTEQLEKMALGLLSDLRLMAETTTQSRVKEIALEKVKLIETVCEVDVTTMDSIVNSSINTENGMRDDVKCRMVREMLSSNSVLTSDTIYKLTDSIKGINTAEAMYLKAVLLMRKNELGSSDLGTDLINAIEWMQTASSMEPDNELYRSYYEGLNEIQEERMRLEKERIAKAEARKKAIERENMKKQREAEQERLRELDIQRRIQEERVRDQERDGLVLLGTGLGICGLGCCCEETLCHTCGCGEVSCCTVTSSVCC